MLFPSRTRTYSSHNCVYMKYLLGLHILRLSIIRIHCLLCEKLRFEKFTSIYQFNEYLLIFFKHNVSIENESTITLAWVACLIVLFVEDTFQRSYRITNDRAITLTICVLVMMVSTFFFYAINEHFLIKLFRNKEYYNQL